MSQDVVADMLVIDDTVDAQIDVEYVAGELLDEDVHDVDLPPCACTLSLGPSRVLLRALSLKFKSAQGRF